MKPFKILIPVFLSMAIIQIAGTVTGEPGSFIGPQMPLVSPAPVQHHAVYERVKKDEMKQLLSEVGQDFVYAKNSLSDAGMATGRPDPVLLRIIAESKMNLASPGAVVESSVITQK